jgi:hypothetical protein
MTKHNALTWKSMKIANLVPLFENRFQKSESCRQMMKKNEIVSLYVEVLLGLRSISTRDRVKSVSHLLEIAKTNQIAH